jgi:hypothetical protein
VVREFAMQGGEEKRERYTILFAIGVIAFILGIGTSFTYYPSSMEPLKVGPPDVVTPLILLGAGTLFLIVGRRGREGPI